MRLALAIALLAAALLLWRVLARRARRAAQAGGEQALLLHLELEAEPDAAQVAALVARLAAAVGPAGQLEEPLATGARVYVPVYGPDAARLLEAALPVLAGLPLAAGSRAIARRGGPGAPEQVQPLRRSAGATPPGRG